MDAWLAALIVTVLSTTTIAGRDGAAAANARRVQEALPPCTEDSVESDEGGRQGRRPAQEGGDEHDGPRIPKTDSPEALRAEIDGDARASSATRSRRSPPRPM